MAKQNFHEEYVPVVFVHSPSEAEFYRALLEDHDIPVMVEESDEIGLSYADEGADIPILVPREQQEDAEVIIEHRESSDEEFDLDFHGLGMDGDDDEDGEVASVSSEEILFEFEDDDDDDTD